MRRPVLAALPLLLAAALVPSGTARAAGGGGPALRARGAMVRVPGGTHRPLYGGDGGAVVSVRAFRLDRDPVTRGDFLAFVRANPQWRRGAVREPAADRSGYLADWPGALEPGTPADLHRPVTGVSWFAAKAYCEWRGARLPSLAEWEYAAAASATSRDATRDPRFAQEVLALYSTRPRPLPPVERGATNVYGVRGLHGLAWEWVSDFAPASPAHDHTEHEHRGHAKGAPRDLSCAGAAIGAADPSNYPAFLRYAFRSGLTGRTTLATLGFRCAA